MNRTGNTYLTLKLTVWAISKITQKIKFCRDIFKKEIYTAKESTSTEIMISIRDNLLMVIE